MEVKYKCNQCGEKVKLFTYTLNRRNGNRCMNCGGFIEPANKVARRIAKIGASHRNRNKEGIVKSFK